MIPWAYLEMVLEYMDTCDPIRLFSAPLSPAARARIHAHEFALALGAPWRIVNHQQRGATK